MKKLFVSVFSVVLLLTACKEDKKAQNEQCTQVKIDYNQGIYNNGANGAALTLPVYMDYQATTPIDPEVLNEMNWISANVYGNANSLHKLGREALEYVDKARKQVADVIKAQPDEIIFTSGATESNNLALKGIVEAYARKTGKKHIITSMTEHACIQESCKTLESEDIDITYLCPKSDGLIDLKELEAAIRPDTLMISIMGVNNEIGVIQDLAAIGKIAKKHKVFFHTDCAQAYGKIPLDVNKMNIDLMSISGHKIYGPKGIGALFVRQHGKGAGCVPDIPTDKPLLNMTKDGPCGKNGCNFKCKAQSKIELLPQMNGGGQEWGIRSGTLAVPLIAGFGKAAELMDKYYERDNKKIAGLHKLLKHGLMSIEGATMNGSQTQRYLGNLNFSFRDVDAMTLVMNLGDKLALSIGSACGSSHEAVDSYVIKAIGVNTLKVGGAVRIGIGRFTTKEEVDFAIQTITDEVAKIREQKASQK